MNKNNLKKIIKEVLLREFEDIDYEIPTSHLPRHQVTTKPKKRIMPSFIEIINPYDGKTKELGMNELESFEYEKALSRMDEEDKQDIKNKYHPTSPWEWLYYYTKEYGGNKTGLLIFEGRRNKNGNVK
jgi:hypothetical protein